MIMHANRHKVGLYFGSFNPIHIGHLIIANHILQTTPLGEIWFVVSPNNPFKEKKSLLNEHQRFYMVKLAIEDNPLFKVSDIEFNLPQPSYTITTMLALEGKYPTKEFALIMGEDNLRGLHKWKNYEQLLSNYQFYVYPRPGYACETTELNKNIHFLESAPLLELSASHIRQLIKEGKSIQYLVPQAVADYIDKFMLYK